MVSIKALVPNTDEKLKAGQFVGITLVREHRANAVVVPEDAVIPYAGKTYVYVVTDGRASRREIVLGERLPEVVEVKSGLKSGEVIVTRGQHRVGEGDVVEQQRGEVEPRGQVGDAKPGDANQPDAGLGDAKPGNADAQPGDAKPADREAAAPQAASRAN
jgi:membrane fusion protein (multidrug efflux system)